MKKHNKRKKKVNAKKTTQFAKKKFTVDICDEYQKLLDSGKPVATDTFESLKKEAKEKGFTRLDIFLPEDFDEVIKKAYSEVVSVKTDFKTDLKWVALFSDFPNNHDPEITPFFLVEEEPTITVNDDFRELLNDKNASADVELEKFTEIAMKGGFNRLDIMSIPELILKYGATQAIKEKWIAVMHIEGTTEIHITPFDLFYDPSDMDDEQKKANALIKIAREIKDFKKMTENYQLNDGDYFLINEYFDKNLNEQTYSFDFYNRNHKKIKSLTREANFEMARTIC